MTGEPMLIERSLNGDQQAFTELVELYHHMVYNLSYRMLGNCGDAEDATQETFLRVFCHLDHYDASRPFKAWVLSIASNYCVDRLRRRRMTWLPLEDYEQSTVMSGHEPTPEETFLHRERDSSVNALLSTLPPEYRAVVILHYWYDLPLEAIADITGSTRSAVKSRLFRARQAMARSLKADTTPAMPSLRRAVVPA